MDKELRSRMEECVLNNGYIMIGCRDVDKLLKYIKHLESAKDYEHLSNTVEVLNNKISELYDLIEAKDHIINYQIGGNNAKTGIYSDM